MSADIKLRIAVTQACNLYCLGCFNEWQNTRAVNYAETEELIKSVKEISGNILSIKLTGGEPLLHKEIAKIATELSTFAPVSITTNGLMLEKRIVDIPPSIPITISCYGLSEKEFVRYTQTDSKVYLKFIKQLKIINNDASRDYSLNVIIGNAKYWRFYEYIDFAVEYGFKTIRFLTQLSDQLTMNSYNENHDQLVGFMSDLGICHTKDGDPSRLYTYADKIRVELIKQYSEFNGNVQNKYGFVWVDYRGNIYKPSGNDVFNAKGFIHVKSI